MAISERAEKLLHFMALADRMKHIERRTCVGNSDRRENDAEHCFHMALCLLVLHKEVDFEVDLGRALSLVLVHDLVEIYAGDTYAYDAAGAAGQQARELEAADRIFGEDLPADTGAYLRELWDEFEAKETPEARLANACDRLQAFLQNYLGKGRVWQENGITPERTFFRTEVARKTDPVFGELLDELYRRAAEEDLWAKLPA